MPDALAPCPPRVLDCVLDFDDGVPNAMEFLPPMAMMLVVVYRKSASVASVANPTAAGEER